MLALISPAKKLDVESLPPFQEVSQPSFLDEAAILIKAAKKLSRNELSRTMKISKNLAELNFQRFQKFSVPFNLGNSKQAAFTFKGDTYVGLDTDSLSYDDIKFAQKQLRIISGLYGILRPLDLIQPYRLEMGAKFQASGKTDLYHFWNGHLTSFLNAELKRHEDKTLINLASNEYFKAIKPDRLNGKVVTPMFKEIKNGEMRTIGMFAKRARGMMARYMVTKRLKSPANLKDFNKQGYIFREELSDEKNWLFTRQQP